MTGISLGRDATEIAIVTADGPRVVASERSVLPDDPTATPTLSALAGRLPGPAGSVVVTVPAWYHDGQRLAVAEAARAAGLTLHCLLSEPVAAALASWVESGAPGGRLLIVDAGSEAVEATVLEAVAEGFEILATDGGRLEGAMDADAAMTATLAPVERAVRSARRPVEGMEVDAAAARLRLARKVLERVVDCGCFDLVECGTLALRTLPAARRPAPRQR